MSRCVDSSFSRPVCRLPGPPSLASSLHSASSSSVLLASPALAHVDDACSDFLLFRAAPTRVMAERSSHAAAAAAAAAAMDSLKMRTFPAPPPGAMVPGPALVNSASLGPAGDLMGGGTLGKFPRTTPASGTLGRPSPAPAGPPGPPPPMGGPPSYHSATNNNKARGAAGELSDGASSSGEEDERHESTPFLHAIQKRIPNGVRPPEDYDAAAVRGAYPEPDDLSGQVSTTAATSLRRGAGVGGSGGDPQRRIVHIPPPPSEPPPSTPRSSLHMGSSAYADAELPPRPHPNHSAVPQLPPMHMGGPARAGVLGSAGSPAGATAVGGHPIAVASALPVSVSGAHHLYGEDPLIATPQVAVLPVNSAGQPMDMIPGFPPNAYLPPVPAGAIGDQYGRPMYSPTSNQPLISPQHMAAVLDTRGRVLAYDSGGTYHSLSKRGPYASASVRSQETCPYQVDPEPKTCWGRFRTGRWCTARNLAMFVLVLFIILLLAFAIYYGILSRWLEKKWKEKFAQNPAVLGLFDPAKPPPYLQLDSSVPHTIALSKFGVWSMRWRSSRSQFVQFNFSLPPRTVIGVYLRQHTVPTIVQYNYFDQISSRDYPATAPVAPAAQWRPRRRHRRHLSRRQRRAAGTATQEGLVHYLEPGLWFISLVNDQPAERRLNMTAFEAVNNRLGCRNQCSYRGTCFNGTNCKCFPRFKGPDCSIREEVKVCNGHGHYVRGECKCFPEWKGKECETLWTECLDPTCSSNGQCIQGVCKCYPGYSGARCENMVCLSPNCSGNGVCQLGRCRCFAGFGGPSCELRMEAGSSKMVCSGHGSWDDAAKRCRCHRGYTGDRCARTVCLLPCLHGACAAGKCECQEGWEGAQCDRRRCDPRCYEHGKCFNGSCVCTKGWNGKHCSLDGCPNGCSNHGNCIELSTGWHCQCTNEWKGKACEYPREMKCSDRVDNDGDKLVDCADPDCCLDPYCVSGGDKESARESCSMATDPTVVLLSKKTVKPTDSFWDRIKFLVDPESVQKGSNPKFIHPHLASVVRGIVRLEDGSPLRGCRVMDKGNLMGGYTLSRADGHFDLVVNGGSLVLLSFARHPTERFQADFRVFAAVNQFVHVGVFHIQDKKHVIKSLVNATRVCRVPGDTFHLLRPVLRSHWQSSAFAACLDSRASVCRETGVLRQSVPLRGTAVRLVYTSTWASGHRSALWIGMTGSEMPRGLAEVHLVVSVAGHRETRQFEADPDLAYVFTWNKRDVYEQKVYGLVATTVEIGYLYKGCVSPIWETRVAYLPGWDMSPSDIGGWNLHIHHVYNWRYGIVYRGDGSHLYLPMQPWRLRPLVGDGHTPRDQDCNTCNGAVFVYKRVLAPTALTTDRLGNVYIMDGDHLRRINPSINYIYLEGRLPGDGSRTGEYYMTVNPTNNSVVVSDSANKRLIMVQGVNKKMTRLVVFARHISYPKGIAYNLAGDMYLADGRAIRVVFANGTSRDVIGRSVQTLEPWRPLACGQSVRAEEMLLQWPTAMAFDPRCQNLYFLDGASVYRLNMATRLVTLVAGRPLNCPAVPDPGRGASEEATLALNAVLNKPNDLAFAPDGSLYIGERYSVRVLRADGRLYNFAGDPSKSCDGVCPVANNERLARDVRFGVLRAIAVNVSGEVIIADPVSYRVHVVQPHTTRAEKSGSYKVVSPDTREVYVFNRHGQHMRTVNALTGTVSHSFEYRVNDINGWLKRVMAGNETARHQLVIERSIRAVPLKLTTPQGLQYRPRVDSEKRLIGLLAPDNQLWRFEYDSVDLLIKMDGPGGHSTWFTYDLDNGNRLAQIIRPSGFVQPSASWEATNASGVSALQVYANGIGLTSRGGLIMDLPNTGTKVRYSLHKYPLQAGVYPMLNARLAQSGRLRHNATWAFVIDEKLQPRSITKELRVNGDLVYQVVYRPPIRGSRLASEIYRARDGKTELFRITYSSTHQPLQVYAPHKGVAPLVSLQYNAVGILRKIQMGTVSHEFTYDKEQRFQRFALGEGRRWTYNYKGNARKPYLVHYPSGAQYSLVYGAGGNLRHVSSSTNHVQSFEHVTLIDRFRVLYWPWSRAAPNSPCRFDFAPSGRLLSFVYPGDFRRVHYLYEASPAGGDRLRAVVAGSYTAKPTYHPKSGLVSELAVEDSARSFKGLTAVAYAGTLPVQLRVAWSLPGVELVECHVKVHYDDRFRVTAVESNFGPRKFHFALRTTYGESSTGVQYNLNEGQFEVDVEFGRTQIRHKGVQWTFLFDAARRLTSARLTNSGVEARTEVTYNGLNRVERLTHYVKSGASSSQNRFDFLYDIDARLQLIKDADASGRTVEQFSYRHDSRLKYFEQAGAVVPVKYDSRGLLSQFDNFLYKFDADGFLESRRPIGSSAKSHSPATEKFYFNARGLLEQAEGPGFRLQFFYDAHDRLAVRTDLYRRGNTLQFFYTDPAHPRRLTHVVNHARSASLLSLLYDPVRGSLYAFGEGEAVYYVHCDHEASPMVVYNRMGRVVWRASYSSTGQATSRVADIWLPLGFRGAYHDAALGFSWLAEGRRLYDTRTGHWMAPAWPDVLHRARAATVFPDALDGFAFEPGLLRPGRLLDPARLAAPEHWLRAWGLRPDQWLPAVSADRGRVAGLGLDLAAPTHPERAWAEESAFRCAFAADWAAFRSVRLLPDVALVGPRRHWALGESAPGLFALEPMFGANLTLTVAPGSRRVQVHGTPAELDRENQNQLLAIILFNNTHHVPWSLLEPGAGVQHYYFVNENLDSAEANLFTLDFSLLEAVKWRELGNGVNVSVVRTGRRYVDVRLRKSRVQYNLRYGVSLREESERVRRLIAKRALDAAWTHEQQQAKLGRRTAHAWTEQQARRLAQAERLDGYTSRRLGDHWGAAGEAGNDLANDPSLLKLLPK